MRYLQGGLRRPVLSQWLATWKHPDGIHTQGCQRQENNIATIPNALSLHRGSLTIHLSRSLNYPPPAQPPVPPG